MAIIHYFGDSNTMGIQDKGSPREGLYYHYSYRDYLNKLLGWKEKNYSRGGKPFMLNVRDLSQQINTFQKGDVVIFQTQFLCNTLLQYPEPHLYHWKDFNISGQKFNEIDYKTIDALYDNNIGLTKEDALTLLSFSTKFEERRSLYDLEVVINLLTYLRKKGVHAYLMYWMWTFDVELPKSKLLFQFKDEEGKDTPYVISKYSNIPTIRDVTNGEWDDSHTDNKFNEEVANDIYNILKKDLDF